MDNKVKVVNLISSRVNISVPESNARFVWERKSAVRTIPLEKLEELMYNPGVEALFSQGVLGIEDTEEPVNIITLNDQQRKRYLTVMPLAEFKENIKKLSTDQIRELAQYAIDNEIMDYDKSEVINKLCGTDIIGTIQLNKADKEQIDQN